ncbi:N-acetyltransferase domain-containing protein [Mycena chlorophos]|uniref:N-acetyltransferase domain-containing protein n=1 Tax=Mycena chlorophos TaxID=658473 RepID=A0A8H6TE44_MYCCL|nr:N-acetyltransferase domain-containing protein [Mycena chlorophos]
MTFQVNLKTVISKAELDEAVDLCVKAYVGEAASDSMVGGDQSLKSVIFRAMTRAGELEGEVYFATENATGKIIGIAIWFPPGTALFGSAAQRALGFDSFMEQISAETKDFWETKYGPEVTKFINESIGQDGSRNSYYLNQLATLPGFQRRGVGSALLRTVHDKFKNSDSPPLFAHCAANEANARFYEGRGYKRRGIMLMEAPTVSYPVIVLAK